MTSVKVCSDNPRVNVRSGGCNLQLDLSRGEEEETSSRPSPARSVGANKVESSLIFSLSFSERLISHYLYLINEPYIILLGKCPHS